MGWVGQRFGFMITDDVFPLMLLHHCPILCLVAVPFPRWCCLTYNSHSLQSWINVLSVFSCTQWTQQWPVFKNSKYDCSIICYINMMISTLSLTGRAEISLCFLELKKSFLHTYFISLHSLEITSKEMNYLRSTTLSPWSRHSGTVETLSSSDVCKLESCFFLILELFTEFILLLLLISIIPHATPARTSEGVLAYYWIQFDVPPADLEIVPELSEERVSETLENGFKTQRSTMSRSDIQISEITVARRSRPLSAVALHMPSVVW